MKNFENILFGLFFYLLTIFTNLTFAQTFGPNSPSVENTLGAAINWTSSSILNSDNTYRQATGIGLTRFLRGQNFGFGLLNTDIVQGIQLEIEKKTTSMSNVALMNPWRHGELSTITNVPLSAGNNRFMVVYISIENGAAPIISSVTFGGVNMTQLISIYNSTSFDAQMEVWYLTEAQLSTLTPGNYNVVANLGAFVQNQYFDILSAAIYNNVDPTNPFQDLQTGSTSAGVPNPWQLPNPLNVGIGGVSVNGVFCGNNTTPAVTNGGTNCWTINSGYTEVVDVYRANVPLAPGSGGCFQQAQKFAAATGTEQPSTTFSGTSNRRIVIALSLRRASAYDNTVQLQKAGVTVGNNYAQITTPWPLTDSYVSYGGPTDLWGSSWTYTDVNQATFGAILSTNLYNGISQVDHMRIIVYTTSILPVQLIDFFAQEISSREVECSWLTASEINTDYFYLERSADGLNFEIIGNKKAAGNSFEILDYSFVDNYPLNGLSYYRLKMVDKDGAFDYSVIKSVNRIVGSDYFIYPNPVQNWATIIANHDKYKFMIVSSAGKVIDSSHYRTFGNTYRFNVENEPDGLYYLILDDGNERKIRTFQKHSAGN